MAHASSARLQSLVTFAAQSAGGPVPSGASLRVIFCRKLLTTSIVRRSNACSTPRGMPEGRRRARPRHSEGFRMSDGLRRVGPPLSQVPAMPATILALTTLRQSARWSGTSVADYHRVFEAPARERHGRARNAPVYCDHGHQLPDVAVALVRTLRARPRERFTPILVLTTEDGDAIKRQGREAGATGWLVKPFDPDQLRHTVRRVLGARA